MFASSSTFVKSFFPKQSTSMLHNRGLQQKRFRRGSNYVCNSNFNLKISYHNGYICYTLATGQNGMLAAVRAAVQHWLWQVSFQTLIHQTHSLRSSLFQNVKQETGTHKDTGRPAFRIANVCSHEVWCAILCKNVNLLNACTYLKPCLYVVVLFDVHLTHLRLYQHSASFGWML